MKFEIYSEGSEEKCNEGSREYTGGNNQYTKNSKRYNEGSGTNTTKKPRREKIKKYKEGISNN